MKHKVLIVLTIGSLGHSAHTMQSQLSKESKSSGCFGLFQRRQKQVAPQATVVVPPQRTNLEVELQKDVEQLSKESTELMMRISRGMRGTEAFLPPHDATHAEDMHNNWVELLKKSGALEHLAKRNIIPAGIKPADVQTSLAAID